MAAEVIRFIVVQRTGPELKSKKQSQAGAGGGLLIVTPPFFGFHCHAINVLSQHKCWGKLENPISLEGLVQGFMQRKSWHLQMHMF